MTDTSISAFFRTDSRERIEGILAQLGHTAALLDYKERCSKYRERIKILEAQMKKVEKKAVSISALSARLAK